eukprot:783890-Rhodomonas_salina.2
MPAFIPDEPKQESPELDSNFLAENLGESLWFHLYCTDRVHGKDGVSSGREVGIQNSDFRFGRELRFP